MAAAGNDGQDAGNSSPAHLQEAITVGASAFDDTMAFFSNYGASVDIFAPGTNITSTWIGGQTALASGTSMATPHVSGFAAYLLSMDSSLTAANVASSISNKALSGALGGIREFTYSCHTVRPWMLNPVLLVASGTANLLLNNGL